LRTEKSTKSFEVYASPELQYASNSDANISSDSEVGNEEGISKTIHAMRMAAHPAEMLTGEDQ